MVEPEQKDEQGLREAVLDQRVFRLCGDESILMVKLMPTPDGSSLAP